MYTTHTHTTYTHLRTLTLALTCTHTYRQEAGSSDDAAERGGGGRGADRAYPHTYTNKHAPTRKHKETHQHPATTNTCYTKPNPRRWFYVSRVAHPWPKGGFEARHRAKEIEKLALHGRHTQTHKHTQTQTHTPSGLGW